MTNKLEKMNIKTKKQKLKHNNHLHLSW